MPERRKAVRTVLATFGVGLVLMLCGVAVALSQASPRLVKVGAPGVRAIGRFGASTIGEIVGVATICQAGEVLPRGVSAIRVSLWVFFGAPVHVSVFAGSRLLTQGSRGADWTSDSVTVPVRALDRTISGVSICLVIAPNSESVGVLGPRTPPSTAALFSETGVPPLSQSQSGVLLLPGRMGVEYLASGTRSWWSRILEVARHAGLGRSFSGTWIAVLIAALTAAAGVLSLRLVLGELQ